jgi:hypothetical protein
MKFFKQVLVAVVLLGLKGRVSALIIIYTRAKLKINGFSS